MILKGWYALHNGWKSKLIIHSKSDQVSRIKLNFYKGESDERVHRVYLDIKPKEFKFVKLWRYKKLKDLYGVVTIESEVPLVAEMYLEDKEGKFLDYALRKVEEKECDFC